MTPRSIIPSFCTQRCHKPELISSLQHKPHRQGKYPPLGCDSFILHSTGAPSTCQARPRLMHPGPNWSLGSFSLFGSPSPPPAAPPLFCVSVQDAEMWVTGFNKNWAVGWNETSECFGRRAVEKQRISLVEQNNTQPLIHLVRMQPSMSGPEDRCQWSQHFRNSLFLQALHPQINTAEIVVSVW